MNTRNILCIIGTISGILLIFSGYTFLHNIQEIVNPIGVLVLLPSLGIIMILGTWDFLDWQDKRKLRDTSQKESSE